MPTETALEQAIRQLVAGAINPQEIVQTIGPLLTVMYVGMVAASVATVLLIVRYAGARSHEGRQLMTSSPGTTFVAGILGIVGLALVGALAMATIIGIPVGLAILLGLLPLLAVGGYAMAAIWIGEWVLGLRTDAAAPSRPYAAALVGVLVLGILSFIPLIGGIASLFGVGAIVRMTRRARRPSPAAA